MLKKIWRIVKGIILSLFILFVMIVFDIFLTNVQRGPMPLTAIIGTICGAVPQYKAIMAVPVEANGKTTRCKLYQRDGAYYLLVGPYPFDERQSDFFFIGRNETLGRGLGEETEDWNTYFGRLYIFFDLTPEDTDASAPAYFFDTKRAEDPATGLVHFTCSANQSGEEETFRFSIPKHLIDALPEYREKAEK